MVVWVKSLRELLLSNFANYFIVKKVKKETKNVFESTKLEIKYSELCVCGQLMVHGMGDRKIGG